MNHDARCLEADPKAGLDPFDATQHLFNCLGRMQTALLTTIADFANRLGLPSDRVRLWMFARCAAEPRGHDACNLWLDVARQIAP